MKKIKYLMPILGISSIAATAIPMASCSCTTTTRDVVIDSQDLNCSQSTNLNGDLVIVLTPKETTKKITGVSQVKIGETVLTSVEYGFNNNKVTIYKDTLSKYNGAVSITPIVEDVVTQVTVTFTNDGNGTVSVASKKVDKDTTFAKAIKDVTVSPNDGYKFSKWLDASGNEVTDDTVISSNMTIKATFVKDAAVEYDMVWSTAMGRECFSVGTTIETSTISVKKDVEYTFRCATSSEHKAYVLMLYDMVAVAEADIIKTISVKFNGTDVPGKLLDQYGYEFDETITATGSLVIKLTFTTDTEQMFPYVSPIAF